MTERTTKTLPRRKRIRLAYPDYQTIGAWYFITICCHEKEPLLRTITARDTVIRILKEVAECQRVEITAYTVLPNHLHLICSSGRYGLIRFAQAFKSRVSRSLRQKVNPDFRWQRSFFDRKIRNEESLRQKCNYVWMNPVRRGLAGKPDDYRWSGRYFLG